MFSDSPPAASRGFVCDPTDDDGHRLSPEQLEYYKQIPLEVLQAELRSWYAKLHALEASEAPNVELTNHETQFSPLRIVQSVKSAHRADIADASAGVALESNEVLNIMESQQSKFLLVEGRAGIGKTT